MERPLTVGWAAIALAVASVGMGASNAEAANFWAEVCQTTGAKGGLYVPSFEPGDKSIEVELNVEDTKADGHHVAVRFVSKTDSGAVRYWAWHHNYGGLHHNTEIDTTATGIPKGFGRSDSRSAVSRAAAC